MNNRINDIIDRYKNYDQLYEVLKNIILIQRFHKKNIMRLWKKLRML